MMRRRWIAAITLSGLLALTAAGCQDQSGPSITPQHPVPLPLPGSFTSKPGKGGMVGGLPETAGSPGNKSDQVGAPSAPGAKTH